MLAHYAYIPPPRVVGEPTFMMHTYTTEKLCNGFEDANKNFERETNHSI